jgi:hypothetical protein
MWKCKACGLFIPIGNCGQIAKIDEKGREEGSKTKNCYNCGKGVGTGFEDNMVTSTSKLKWTIYRN